MATSQETLAMHPSVQDLDMDLTRVNPRKVHYHKLVINSGPLHEPSDHGRSSLVKKNVPKGQTVTTIRNDANLKAAARALLIPSEVGAGSKGITIPPVLKKTGGVPPLTSPVSASSESPLGASTGSQGGGVVKRPSSIQNTNHNKRGPKLTSDRLAGLSATSSQEGLPIPLPPVLGASASSNKVGAYIPAPRRASSIVSSKVSFAATDAESFSVYSCSCCHVRPPSSYVGNASDYDNLTSVSQRPSNHTSVVSISSTKLRKLEDDLKQERKDRLKTQQDLAVIQQRQALLLSKLSEDERNKLDALVLQVK